MSGAYVLAVDQSTAATKACLFDRNGIIRHRATVEHAQHYPRPGWVEHDPLEIVERSHQAIEAVLHKNDVDEGRIAAVAISNQRETIVAWDRRTGMPVHNALVWQDERGTPICEQLVRDGKRGEIEERTGLVIDWYFSAC
ncbi:MAG: FGGY family carbohydrate kinase [Spirochaeta sp.]|nr:FGGY family carbohydrate kinase [Spirochaeta sp.]